MAKKKSPSCVPDMVEATKGILSEAEARELIQEVSRQAIERAKAKNIPIEDAVREVAWERRNQINLAAENSRRQRALQAKAKLQILRYVTQTKDKGGRSRWDKNLDQYMENAYQSAAQQGDYFLVNWFNQVGDRTLMERLRTDETLKTNVDEELWNLSLDKPASGGVTKDADALRVATAFYNINKQAVELKNLYGADIRQAPGWTRPQTHDEYRIQEAGGGSKDPKERYQSSLATWKQSFEPLNVDWDRTLKGQSRDQFLTEFHKDIYYRYFKDSVDPDIEGNPYTRTGSLASKVSTDRKLWFKDAASQRAYNEMWGKNDLFEGLSTHLVQSGRTIALLQNFGPSPDTTLRGITDMLADMVVKQQGDPKLVKKFQGESFQQQLDFLSGKAQSTVNANMSKAFDAARNFNLLTKGANITISTLGDRVFMATEAVQRGVPRMEAFGKALVGRLSSSADSERVAREMGLFMHSWAGFMASRWMNSDRIAGAMSKGVHRLYQWTGLSWMTDIHRHIAGDLAAHNLGRNSDKAWTSLSRDMQGELESFGITHFEWDMIRSSMWKMEDGSPVITADAVRSIPNEVLDKELTSRGVDISSGNRKRLREDMAAKVGVYSNTWVNRSVPNPNLKAKTVMTQGAKPRGTWSREVGDLFAVFKGFPVAAAMSVTRNVRGQFSQGHYAKGLFYLSSVLAQSIVAGYTIMTIKDFLKGRIPRALMSDGEVNWGNLTAAAAQGGGLGIYGDFLLSEYDRRTRTPTSALVGPVVGTAGEALLLGQSAIRAVFGDEDVNAEALGYNAFRFAEANTPFINTFYIKPILDHLIFWHIKEGLSPGVITRQRQSIEEKNHQEFWLEPLTY